MFEFISVYSKHTILEHVMVISQYNGAQTS